MIVADRCCEQPTFDRRAYCEDEATTVYHGLPGAVSGLNDTYYCDEHAAKAIAFVGSDAYFERLAKRDSEAPR